MIKILSVFGTRPEVIKMAPVVKELNKFPDKIISQVCVTAQHRDMIDPLLKLFDIKVDYDLNIMKKNQIFSDITTAVLTKVGEIIREEKPDYVIVQGDTTTSMAAALAAYYEKTKIVHVEAGLRTWNKYHPFPEEVNRVMIDSMADLYCVPTKATRENLLSEGKKEQDIVVTGNTVIDTLLDVSQRDVDLKQTVLASIPFEKKIILVTSHRKENLGGPLTNVCEALKQIASSFAEEAHIIFPVHPNPKVRDCVYALLDGIPNVSLIEPLDYVLFIHMFKQVHIVLTDSGGIQEEAPSLNKPVLVMREVTERGEAVEVGALKMVGTCVDDIVRETKILMTDKNVYESMSHVENPYGDGHASEKIVAEILKRAENHG